MLAKYDFGPVACRIGNMCFPMWISADERYGGRPSVPANILTAVLAAALARRPVGWPDKMDFSIIVFELPHPKTLSQAVHLR